MITGGLAVGNNRKLRGLAAASLLLAVTAVGSCTEGGGDFPEVDGWTRAGDVLTYDADNLWEYIDGAAELFVAYDVQSCRTADLSSGDVTVTLDLYDMGTPLSAFGVFDQEASGESVDLRDATAAVLSPPFQALLLKGSTYAKVNTFEGELDMEHGRQLLEALARALPGSTDLPAELALLPSEGRVSGTEAYQAEAFLGLTELTDCVFADYSGNGEESWTGFVVVPAEAEAVWERLSGDWTTVEHGDGTVLTKEVPYRGWVGVTRRGSEVLGVTGAADVEGLLTRLDAFGG